MRYVMNNMNNSKRCGSRVSVCCSFYPVRIEQPFNRVWIKNDVYNSWMIDYSPLCIWRRRLAASAVGTSNVLNIGSCFIYFTLTLNYELPYYNWMILYFRLPYFHVSNNAYFLHSTSVHFLFLMDIDCIHNYWNWNSMHIAHVIWNSIEPSDMDVYITCTLAKYFLYYRKVFVYWSTCPRLYTIQNI